MTDPLPSPVEALQREIDIVREAHACLAEISQDFASDNRSLTVRLAALELAKAVAAIKDDHLTGCGVTMGDSHPCTCGLPRKLAALIEALQR